MTLTPEEKTKRHATYGPEVFSDEAEELGTTGYTVRKQTKGNSYTLQATDSKVLVLVPAPGEGVTVTVTVPTNASAGIAMGADVQVWKVPAGLGTVTIKPANGVTILFGGSAIEESGQNVGEAPLFLLKVASNEWLLHE